VPLSDDRDGSLARQEVPPCADMVAIAMAIVIGFGVKQLFLSHSAAMPNADTVKVPASTLQNYT
jgi:hypothetical protein